MVVVVFILLSSLETKRHDLDFDVDDVNKSTIIRLRIKKISSTTQYYSWRLRSGTVDTASMAPSPPHPTPETFTEVPRFPSVMPASI